MSGRRRAEDRVYGGSHRTLAGRSRASAQQAPPDHRPVRHPLAISLTSRHRHDVTQLMPLLDAIPRIRGIRGRPRHRPGRLFADRGHHYDKYRRLLRARGITPKIARKALAQASCLRDELYACLTARGGRRAVLGAADGRALFQAVTASGCGDQSLALDVLVAAGSGAVVLPRRILLVPPVLRVSLLGVAVRRTGHVFCRVCCRRCPAA